MNLFIIGIVIFGLNLILAIGCLICDRPQKCKVSYINPDRTISKWR